MRDHETIKSLIGRPYEELNCWGLTVKFYSLVLKTELSGIYDGPEIGRSHTENLIYSNKGEFERVDVPQFGDIILIRLYGFESHIAVYLDNGLMLHTSKNTGSVIENTARWKNLIVGYYRIGKSNVKNQTINN